MPGKSGIKAFHGLRCSDLAHEAFGHRAGAHVDVVVEPEEAITGGALEPTVNRCDVVEDALAHLEGLKALFTTPANRRQSLKGLHEAIFINDVKLASIEGALLFHDGVHLIDVHARVAPAELLDRFATELANNDTIRQNGQVVDHSRLTISP